MNVKLQIIMINALNVMLQIIVMKHLMEIYSVNANAMMVTMMMGQIMHANNAIIVGKQNLNYNNFK